jgi:hypothetical protein
MSSVIMLVPKQISLSLYGYPEPLIIRVIITNDELLVVLWCDDSGSDIACKIRQQPETTNAPLCAMAWQSFYRQY